MSVSATFYCRCGARAHVDQIGVQLWHAVPAGWGLAVDVYGWAHAVCPDCWYWPRVGA